jgi:hypothetical protein
MEIEHLFRRNSIERLAITMTCSMLFTAGGDGIDRSRIRSGQWVPSGLTGMLDVCLKGVSNPAFSAFCVVRQHSSSPEIRQSAQLHLRASSPQDYGVQKTMLCDA